jgi:hypothetical protein
VNEIWSCQLAQVRLGELRKEADEARRFRATGVQGSVPGAVKLIGLVLLGLPFVVVLVRVVGKV